MTITVPDPATTRGTPTTRTGVRLDPRTKLLVLILVSGTVLSPSGSHWVPAGVIMAVALMLLSRLWRPMLIFLATLTIGLITTVLLPQLGHDPAFGVLAVAVSYLVRLIIVAAVAACLTATISPTAMTAALRAIHVPRAITVPLAVMIRFLPTVIDEGRAVRDAMRLRGLGTGPIALIRSPMASLEYFAVPMIASCLRVAEELSASALLRGLGSTRRPTAMEPPRFGIPDLLIVIGTGILAAITIGWWLR